MSKFLDMSKSVFFEDLDDFADLEGDAVLAAQLAEDEALDDP